MIKCNIGVSGDKIYHLPMDQQYDRIINKKNSKLTYCKTINEAESLGYRKAYKWKGNIQ